MPQELIQRVLGEGLQTQSWLRYIHHKYEALYGPFPATLYDQIFHANQ